MNITLSNRLSRITSVGDLKQQIMFSSVRVNQLAKLSKVTNINEADKVTLLNKQLNERNTLQLLKANYKAIKSVVNSKTGDLERQLFALIKCQVPTD